MFFGSRFPLIFQILNNIWTIRNQMKQTHKWKFIGRIIWLFWSIFVGGAFYGFCSGFFPHIKHIDFELTEYKFLDSQVPLK